MNWGKGIIIGMALFMGFIITLVVIMMRQDIDLVQEDYYQKELTYNKEYDAHTVYEQAEDTIGIAVKPGFVSIQLGKAFQDDSVHIELRRPNNQDQDMKFSLLAQPEINIPSKDIPKGQFECIITGKIANGNYQYDQTIYVD